MARTAQSTIKAPSKSTIIAPFTQPPSTLTPFLDRLDPAQVHLTHIDRTPRETKRSIFTIPVLLNGTIALLLLWRIYAAGPQYWSLARAVLGYRSTASAENAAAAGTLSRQAGVLFRRTAMFAADAFLLRFVAPWPVTFFAERPANPCVWRWRLGIRDEEVVVRVSRRWGTAELMEGGKRGGESAFFKTRIAPVLESVVMRKTGYLMMDKNWDLDFELMLDAHKLIERGELKMEDLDKMVFAYQEGVGWVVWQWERPDDVAEGRRQKVVLFKEKLTAMGKESLFWRWTEIVEEERDTDGGFTLDRQQRVASRVREEFEQHGVDFDQLEKSIGGFETVT